MKHPLILMILDGFGINHSDYGNAIHAAKKPNLDKYFSQYPHTQIGASALMSAFRTGRWATRRLATPTSVRAASSTRS